MECMLRAEVEHMVLQDGLKILLTKEDAGTADFNTMRKYCLIALFPHNTTRSEQEEAMKWIEANSTTNRFMVGLHN